ncbi:MAG: NADH oxidase [Mycoplasmataceae bacterium]|nr:NADH oxidase [Mycoplasmataceae bacterium]
MMKKLIVIGANHAGTAVMNIVADKSMNWEITTYDSNDNCSFLGCGIALWMSGKIENPQDLFYSSPEILRNKKIKVNMMHRVENIDYVKKQIIIRDLKTNEIKIDYYDKLVISVGSWPISPLFKNSRCEDWDNAINVKLYQHGQALIKKLEDPRINKISIVGGGYIGVELAEAAQIHGKEVTLIDLSPRLLGTYYDREFTDKMEARIKAKGIKLNLNQSVEEIIGENKLLTALKTNENIVETDLAIFCIGAKPNTKWLQNENLKMINNGAIIVNNRQQTSIDDVYAVGDCATVHNSILDKDVSIALASNAVRSGMVAGFNIIGQDKNSFEGVEGSNAISIYGLNMMSTGLTMNGARMAGINAKESYFEGPQKLGFMNDNHQVSIKVVYDAESRVILGAQLASTYDVSMAIHLFSLAASKKVKIDELKFMDLFFLPHFNSPFNYINEVALKAE